MEKEFEGRSVKGRSLPWLEALVILAILAIMTVILSPFISHPRGPKQNTCMNNQRQLIFAISVYFQDNHGRLPGISWTKVIEKYTDDNVQIWTCYADKRVKRTMSLVSYGYNGNLIDAQGQGLLVDTISNPTTAVTLADASPPCARTAGGLLGAARQGPGGQAIPAVYPDYRHNAGLVLAYLDGHIDYTTKPLDLTAGITTGKR